MYRHIWRCKPLRESGGAAESRRCTNVSPSQVEAEESRSWNESAGVRDEAESRPVTRTVCVRADKYRACRVPRVFSSLCFFSASLAAKKNRPIRFRVRTIQCVQRARVSACSVDRVVKLAALGLSPGRRQDHSNDCTVSIYSWNKFYVEMNSDIFWIGISRYQILFTRAPLPLYVLEPRIRRSEQRLKLAARGGNGCILRTTFRSRYWYYVCLLFIFLLDYSFGCVSAILASSRALVSF